MIGVLSKPSQAAAVEEFFQLFKTPWEYYDPDQSYDVVLTTIDTVPEIDAKLVLIYGAAAKSTDAPNGFTIRSRQTGGCLDYGRTGVPIYGDLAIFDRGVDEVPCLFATACIAGLRREPRISATIVRLGYDLFDEIQFLLTAGQPAEHAAIPTLDLHISLLKRSILREGVPILEIPAAPADHSFTVCLTHDIDFVGIRNHKFDHTMWGFLYRSTFGAVRNLFRRRISLVRLCEMWWAAASLPFVYLGLIKDFWNPFEWYLRVEKGLPATYFLIPFKRHAGEHVPVKNAARRATAYDADDVRSWIAALRSEGCEIGVHGIDGWHSVERGRAELARIAEITGESEIGVRIHWLLGDIHTPTILDQAHYAYDSTKGYNETTGYRCGTTQVFRPLGTERLLEVPLHIQDGALFYPDRLDLSESEAETRCKGLIENAGQFGGVLTLLWHDRSHGPERFWGEFYTNLVDVLKSTDAWFATANQAAAWFRRRRDVRFERSGNSDGIRVFIGNEEEKEADALPDLCFRVHTSLSAHGEEVGPLLVTDIPWNARTVVEFDSLLRRVSEVPAALSRLEIC